MELKSDCKGKILKFLLSKEKVADKNVKKTKFSSSNNNNDNNDNNKSDSRNDDENENNNNDNKNDVNTIIIASYDTVRRNKNNYFTNQVEFEIISIGFFFNFMLILPSFFH